MDDATLLSCIGWVTALKIGFPGKFMADSVAANAMRSAADRAFIATGRSADAARRNGRGAPRVGLLARPDNPTRRRRDRRDRYMTRARVAVRPGRK
jgi:hypothetical protein